MFCAIDSIRFTSPGSKVDTENHSVIQFNRSFVVARSCVDRKRNDGLPSVGPILRYKYLANMLPKATQSEPLPEVSSQRKRFEIRGDSWNICKLELPMKHMRRLLILVALLTANSTFADVALLKTAGVVAFEEARNGFVSICFENKKEFDLSEDLSNKDDILNSIQSGNYKLVFAIGSQAANLIRTNLPDMPLVFAFVIEPDKQGFKKEHSTGVALKVPVREQFIVLKTVSRNFKKIGVIYTQSLNDSLIAAARTAADDENLEIVPAPIHSSQDLQQVMTDLVGKADVLWIPPDPSLNTEEVIKYIGSKSLESRIPCVGPTDRYVRSGAIFSYSVDPLETGRLAGELANKVIEGTPTSKLPFLESQKPKVIINLKAAALLGLVLPQNLQNAATKIYQ